METQIENPWALHGSIFQVHFGTADADDERDWHGKRVPPTVAKRLREEDSDCDEVIIDPEPTKIFLLSKEAELTLTEVDKTAYDD